MPWITRLRPLALIACLAFLTTALSVGGCASGAPKTKPGQGAKILRDGRITKQQLDELSNAFADRYFTLMLAASAGHQGVLRLLIKGGANVSMTDAAGLQPLHYAAGDAAPRLFNHRTMPCARAMTRTS